MMYNVQCIQFFSDKIGLGLETFPFDLENLEFLNQKLPFMVKMQFEIHKYFL